MSGSIYSWKEQVGVATGCPGKWWSCHPWRYLKHMWMWHLGTQFRGGLGSVRLCLDLMILRIF